MNGEVSTENVLNGKIGTNNVLTGEIGLPAGGAEPVLETLKVNFGYPLQKQTITPPTGVDGFSSVEAGPAAAISVTNTFMILGAGYDYDAISSLEYIAVYDYSGRKSTKFYKQS